MCWNASVSLNTFLFSLFTIVLAVFNNVLSIPLAAYYLSFVSMQLVEYFLWKNIDKIEYNTLWSKIALVVIILQPIMTILCIGYSDPIMWLMLTLYLLFILYVATVVKPFHTIDFSSERAENGHLRWNWLKFPLWVLVIWVGFVFFENIYHHRWLDAFWKICVVAIIYYTYIQSGTWGSMWCWIANAIAIYLLWRIFSKDICIGKKNEKKIKV